MGEWQPIETAPEENRAEFLVFDGFGVFKVWRINGEIQGFETDGSELPDNPLDAVTQPTKGAKPMKRPVVYTIAFAVFIALMFGALSVADAKFAAYDRVNQEIIR